MKLIASVIVRNELGRYLEPFVEHLLAFCDEIRMFDDGSEDKTFYALHQNQRVWMTGRGRSTFYSHEGKARQELLDWTLSGRPTHVLSIDADEFIDNGVGLRRMLELYPEQSVWSLKMEEVWEAYDDGLCVRTDGAWGPAQVPILYRVPETRDGRWRIADRALACGRSPIAVTLTGARAAGVSCLHFGWANEAERVARYQRYVEHDGGRFHNRRHLDSILWPCDRIRLLPRPWTEQLAPYRDRILERATREMLDGLAARS